LGCELGSRIYSGQALPELAEEKWHVVAAWYEDRCDMARASHDPVTIYQEVLGFGMIFEFANWDGV
jgi:hypothetical protein